MSRYTLYNATPSPAFRLGGVSPAFLTGSVGFYVRWLSPLHPLLEVQLLISKAKYTYQKLNIHKSKLLNCNINIKNTNQYQTFSNSVPALLQSKTICIFADGGEYTLGMCLGHPSPYIYIMAQSKSFFGLRKGSTKSLTFSVYNGKQVTKDRVIQVKNPRSSLQMKQRAIMATAVKAYSAMKEICDHSNETLPYGQKTMNWFIRENANLLRSMAPYCNLSYIQGNSVCNSYIVSKGSLNAPEVNYNGTLSFAANKPGFATEILTKSAEGITMDEVLKALGAKKDGDMVTFIMLQNMDASASSNAAFYWLRLKFLADYIGSTIDFVENKISLTSLFTEGVGLETNIDNYTEGDFEITLHHVTKGNKHTYWITIGNPDTIGDGQAACTLIASSKTDAGWLRSTSRLAYNDFDVNYNAALASYPTNGEKILNGGNM